MSNNVIAIGGSILFAVLNFLQTSKAENPPAAKLNPAAQRILERIAALKKTMPALAQLPSPAIDDDGNATLYFERGVTWKLEDPTQPASKLNARLAEYEPGGFWIRLYFYQGPWRGAAMFRATDLGDKQNLWFSYGYRPGDDAAVIIAIAKLIDEESPKPKKP
jgi:hypothetical protein